MHRTPSLRYTYIHIIKISEKKISGISWLLFLSRNIYLGVGKMAQCAAES